MASRQGLVSLGGEDRLKWLDQAARYRRTAWSSRAIGVVVVEPSCCCHPFNATKTAQPCRSFWAALFLGHADGSGVTAVVIVVVVVVFVVEAPLRKKTQKKTAWVAARSFVADKWPYLSRLCCVLVCLRFEWFWSAVLMISTCVSLDALWNIYILTMRLWSLQSTHHPKSCWGNS